MSVKSKFNMDDNNKKYVIIADNYSINHQLLKQ